MKIKFSIILLALLILIISTACAHVDGPYKGKVLDLETGQPIEGAVVAAEWAIEEVPHAQKRCDVEETVTDKNGEFVLPKGSCISHPLAVIFGPYVVVFKPGYLGYPPLGATEEERISHMPDWGKPRLFKNKKQYNVVRLGRPKTQREREFTVGDASIFHDETGFRKLPFLLKLVNEELESLGVGKIGPSGSGGRK